MRVLLVTAALAAPAVAHSPDIRAKFEEFKTKFAKQYHSAAEEAEKLNNFAHTVAKAELMKVMDPSAHHTYRTPLADMSEEEYSKRNNLQVTKQDLAEHEETAEELEIVDDLPDEWDWVEQGAVTGVKDQGQCGSCWSFGTVANIEGQNWLVNKGKQQFAEQELVDCSNSDMGCNGGLPSRAYNDMIHNHMGLELESAYPYHARVGKCKANPAKEKVYVSSWKKISTKEDQIQAALMKYGPLAIGVNAGPFQTYDSGVLDPFFCNPLALDHAVTLVGWGVDKDSGKKFWKIKNSWGGRWGEGGYIRVARGNWIPTCGMNRMVTTAIVAPQEEQEGIYI